MHGNVDRTKVLICYHFPSSFKTADLEDLFGDYRGHFRIKWIDDHSAFIIFEDPRISMNSDDNITFINLYDS